MFVEVGAMPGAWRNEGLCREVDPDAWYPEKGDPVGPAKRVCQQCPVRMQCLEYALANREAWGVWGGLSTRERQKLLTQRRAAA